MKVLVDAMRDGLDIKLNELGYKAYSVKKLVDKGEKFQSDFSILRYAQDNDMVLITEDIENIKACKENNIECVEFAQNQTLEYLLNELEKIKLRKKS